MGGRPPKPMAQHKLEKPKLYGDLAERSELEPESNLIPKCPDILTKEERKAWRYYADILKSYGMLTIANAPMLEIVARLHAETIDFHDKARGKPIIKSPKGDGYIVNPFWSARKKNEDTMIVLLKELGLSSIGIARLGSLALTAKKKKSEFFED
jgi:phage terminase small subunit